MVVIRVLTAIINEFAGKRFAAVSVVATVVLSVKSSVAELTVSVSPFTAPGPEIVKGQPAELSASRVWSVVPLRPSAGKLDVGPPKSSRVKAVSALSLKLKTPFEVDRILDLPRNPKKLLAAAWK